MTPPEIEPATFRLAAQCLKLHHWQRHIKYDYFTAVFNLLLFYMHCYIILN